jgi:splicing factor 3A subunit 3
MSSTLLELARGGHEEMEVGVNKVVKLLAAETKTQKQKLIQQHKVLKEVKTLQVVAGKLAESYEDKDGGRKQEIESMSGADIFGSFYGKLRDLQAYHRKFPNLYYDQGPTDIEVNLVDDPEILSQFSAEEMNGRFLDLNALHQKFINLKGATAVPYDVYLAIFLNFSDVPLNVKTKRYRDYLFELKDYLVSFLHRSQPLVDTKGALEGAFEEGMEKELPSVGPKVDGDTLVRSLDLASFASVEQLVEIGGDMLKEELQKLGLKCGGTPADRAKRLWSTKGFTLRSQLDPKIVAPALVKKKVSGRQTDTDRHVSLTGSATRLCNTSLCKCV